MTQKMTPTFSEGFDACREVLEPKVERLERDLAQARAEAARMKAALEHIIEHLELRDDGGYIEQLARAALEAQ